jgi:tRNA wybutosine-synthesizing protein 4
VFLRTVTGNVLTPWLTDVTKSFGDFMAQAAAGGNVYLRATSASEPTERPARLEDDFPSLSPDFVLPPELHLISDESAFFSSVLRIQGKVNMWLHYDVSC